MASKKLDINPVFNHRKKSIALVDTAEDLVESLDNLSVCLKHIEEKHVQDDKEKTTTSQNNLYEKLRENLEVARDLTDTLKREKWRLSRREMSIEIRKDELEEYKTHLKRDMTDMNQTVDVLSVRIIQLENELCEAQELQESTEAEKEDLCKQLEESCALIKEHEAKEAKLMEEIQTLKGQRKDTMLRLQNEEFYNEKEILLIENQKLKEIIREKDDNETKSDKISDTGSETLETQVCSSCQNKSSTSSVPTTPTSPTITQFTEVAYV